jgi:hypothetical protein
MFADADWQCFECVTTPSEVSIASNSVQCLHEAYGQAATMKNQGSCRYHSTGVIHEKAENQVKVSKIWAFHGGNVGYVAYAVKVQWLTHLQDHTAQKTKSDIFTVLTVQISYDVQFL